MKASVGVYDEDSFKLVDRLTSALWEKHKKIHDREPYVEYKTLRDYVKWSLDNDNNKFKTAFVLFRQVEEEILDYKHTNIFRYTYWMEGLSAQNPKWIWKYAFLAEIAPPDVQSKMDYDIGFCRDHMGYVDYERHIEEIKLNLKVWEKFLDEKFFPAYRIKEDETKSKFLNERLEISLLDEDISLREGLKLAPRACNPLEENGIITVNQVLRLAEKDLYKFKKFGNKSFDLLMERLKSLKEEMVG